MTGDRWPEVDRLCAAALERDAHARSAFLDEACAGDHELRREVESLLAAQAAGDAVFATPAIEAAAQAFAAREDGPSLSAPVGQLATGTRLGPYEIDTLIASGGMGQRVPRARHPAGARGGGEGAAVGSSAADPGPTAALPARGAGGCRAQPPQHPRHLRRRRQRGSPRTRDETADPPVHYLVIELLEGQTLRERIARGTLPVSDALAIAVHVARALAAAHGKHIVHRDLKPSNVFLTADGQVQAAGLRHREGGRARRW